MSLTAEDIKELQEDLRVGSILIAKLTDQCRELEAQLAECEKHPDYDPQAEEFGWYIEHGWLPPCEVEKLRKKLGGGNSLKGDEVMPELTDRDAINLMLRYYGRRYPARDTARIVALLSKAGVVELVQDAYSQGVLDEKGSK